MSAESEERHKEDKGSFDEGEEEEPLAPEHEREGSFDTGEEEEPAAPEHEREGSFDTGEEEEPARARARARGELRRGGVVPQDGTRAAEAPPAPRGTARGSDRQASSSTERMFPAGSLNQAMSGPLPRAMPFSSCSKPS